MAAMWHNNAQRLVELADGAATSSLALQLRLDLAEGVINEPEKDQAKHRRGVF
jgi:hypothetical protein